MTRSLLAVKFAGLFCLAIILSIAGCGGSSEKSYHPTVNSARDALTAALSAWQEGQAQPGKIESCKPPVQVADPVWSAGKKLKSFEILKEEQIPDGPQKLTVKLTLDGVVEQPQVVYVVIGKDPLWVLREEEYQRGFGM